jgi:hypothetical protein
VRFSEIRNFRVCSRGRTPCAVSARLQSRHLLHHERQLISDAPWEIIRIFTSSSIPRPWPRCLSVAKTRLPDKRRLSAFNTSANFARRRPAGIASLVSAVTETLTRG